MLGEFNIILPSEDCTGHGADCIQIDKVQIELDTDKLKALRMALVCCAVLNRQEDGGIIRHSSPIDNSPTRIMP